MGNCLKTLLQLQKFLVKTQVNSKYFLLFSYIMYILGLSADEAKTFITKHKLQNRKPHFMIDSFKTYKRLGFTTQEILENGKLFNCFPTQHENFYKVMQEGGFSSLKASVILRFVNIFFY